MPRADDPGVKIKNVRIFKRKPLRAWDEIQEFIPKSQLNETISKPIDNKNESYSEQLVNPLGNETKTKVEQEITISKPLVNESDTKVEPIREPIKGIISEPIVNQLVNNLETVSRLYGLQRTLLFYIVENCRSRGLLYTSPITNEVLQVLLNRKADIVKTTTQRLINKGLIQRGHCKRGRGGFSIFMITEDIRNAVIEVERQLEKSKPKEEQLVNVISKLIVNKKETEKETNALSSSSYIDNNKTTTTAGNELSPDWLELDWSNLQERLPQFGMTQIKQAYPFLRQYPVEDIQDMIDGMVDDYDQGIFEQYKRPVNVIMGVFREGNLWQPSRYISPRRQAIRKQIELLKQQEEERAELQRLQEQNRFLQWIDANRAEIEQELRDKNPSFYIAFKNNGSDALEFIRKTIYAKAQSS